MSISIVLYNCTCEQNRVDKSGYISQVATLTGTLREQTDIVSPSINIEYSGFPAVNYAYIAAFSRYYYIDDITSLATDLWRFDMREDVLMSFKGNKNGNSSTGIYGLSAYVDRYEGATDRNLVDTAYPLYGNATRTSYLTTLSGSWMGSNYFMEDPISGAPDYRYLVTFNGNALNSSQAIIKSNLIIGNLLFKHGELQDFMSLLQSQQSLTSNTPSQYIQSIKCFPFSLIPTGYVARYMDVPGIMNTLNLNFDANTATLKYKEVTLSATVTPPSTVNQFKNYLPYTNITLTFAPFGRFALDNSIVFANATSNVTVYLKIRCDVLSGNANLYYGTSSSTANIYLGSANIAIECPLMASSYSLMNQVGGVLSAAGSVAGMMSGNPAAVVGAASGVMNMVSAFDVASATVSSGDTKIIDSQARIDVQFHDIPDTSVPLFGRPYAMTNMLGNLYGYAQIGRVHVEGLTMPALDREIQEIESLLTEGVIL